MFFVCSPMVGFLFFLFICKDALHRSMITIFMVKVSASWMLQTFQHQFFAHDQDAFLVLIFSV